MRVPLLAAGLLALAACTEAQHPLDRHLSRLRPVTIAPLAGLEWPAGTLLCPLTPYQSSLPTSAPQAARVNAFLASKQFLGDETHWSLVAIKPAPAGDASIAHLVFKRGGYDIVTDQGMLKTASGTVPAGFTLQVCVPVEQARVLVTRAVSSPRILIGFGTT